MTNFDHMISYLASKGVKMVVKVDYENGLPSSKSLLTNLVISKVDRFYRVNGHVVSRNMAQALMRMAA